MLTLSRVFFEQARVFENGRRFNRQRLQQLAIARREIGRDSAANPYTAARRCSRAVEVMRVSSDDPLRICTRGRHTTLRSSSAATRHFRANALLLQWDRNDIDSRSRREFERALDHRRRNAQFVRLREALPDTVARDGDFQFGGLCAAAEILARSR